MSSPDERPWRFLTNHTQVLICIARAPDVRLRDVAEQVGITERAAQRILADLVEAGYVERKRHGRRNSYRISEEQHMRHPAQEDIEIRASSTSLTTPTSRSTRRPERPSHHGGLDVSAFRPAHEEVLPDRAVSQLRPPRRENER